MPRKFQKTIYGYKYLIIATVTCLFGVVAILLIVNSSGGRTEDNTDLHPYPTNGTYGIVSTHTLACTKSLPPICHGEITLTSGDPHRFTAEIDHDTQVRYQSIEMQAYPSALKEGMTGQVTFKSNSATIASITIDD